MRIKLVEATNPTQLHKSIYITLEGQSEVAFRDSELHIRENANQTDFLFQLFYEKKKYQTSDELRVKIVEATNRIEFEERMNEVYEDLQYEKIVKSHVKKYGSSNYIGAIIFYKKF